MSHRTPIGIMGVESKVKLRIPQINVTIINEGSSTVYVRVGVKSATISRRPPGLYGLGAQPKVLAADQDGERPEGEAERDSVDVSRRDAESGEHEADEGQDQK